MINLTTTYHKSASSLRMSPSPAGILLFVIRGYLSINYTFTATMRQCRCLLSDPIPQAYVGEASFLVTNGSHELRTSSTKVNVTRDIQPTLTSIATAYRLMATHVDNHVIFLPSLIRQSYKQQQRHRSYASQLWRVTTPFTHIQVVSRQPSFHMKVLYPAIEVWKQNRPLQTS